MKMISLVSEFKKGKNGINEPAAKIIKLIKVLWLAIVAISMLLSVAIVMPAAGAAMDVCKDSARTIHYDVAAIDVAIPVNGWGDFNPQGMMYALDNPLATPNVEQIKDPNFKLYNTTDMTLPDKVMPLVLRANEGDCIEVTLTNRLDQINTTVQAPFTPADGPAVPINPASGARKVGMQVTGLALNVSISDGASVGYNPDTTVAPGSSMTYRWFANRTGGFLFRDISNPQFPQDTINKGLYGMIIIEEKDSVWFDSVTGRHFLLADNPSMPGNPQFGYNLSDIIPDPEQPTDLLTGMPRYLGVGANIFASVHQKEPCLAAGCNYPLPRGALLYENVSGNDYRSYAMIMQDEMEGIVGPTAWDADGNVTQFGKPFFPATGLPDSTFAWNYKSEPLRNRMSAWLRHRGLIPTPGSPPQSGTPQTIILPNGRTFTPEQDFCNGGNFEAVGGKNYTFYPCEGEESHLQSWPFGDPAVALPRAYWGDPVVFYAATAASHETHTYHQHAQRWFHDPEQGDANNLPLPENYIQRSNRLDVQGIGPGEVFKLVFEQGAGSTMGTAGDEIVHCHLYPHFAGGLWSSFRVFDMLRVADTNNPLNMDPININARLESGELLLYPDGTQEAVLMPLPAKEALIAQQQALTGVRQAPPAPRGMPNRTAGVPSTTHPGYPNFVAGKFGLKALQPPMFVVNQSTGIPEGDRAVPTDLEINASYDGISPGVTLVDPCAGPNREFGPPNREPDRIYQPVAIQVPYLLNPKGWFNPEQRAYVEKEFVDEVRKDPRKLRPYSFRANVGDCIEVYGKNDLQPDPETATLGVNDGIFHGPTITNEVSNHVHIIRFDELGSDGTSVNWNYDISQRTGETGAYRWFVDVNGRTVFSHDHQFPTSHQQGGMWAAFIIEPNSSEYMKPDGTQLGPVSLDPAINLLTASNTNIKGVGVAAIINVTNAVADTTGGISGGNISAFREFAVHLGDFTPAFFVQDAAALNAAFDSLNATGVLVSQPFKNDSSLAIFNPAFRTLPYSPPFNPDKYGDDQGINTLNYRVEPFQTRVNITSPNANMREPAYVYSSKVWGDPYTVDYAAGEFMAYMNDPVVIRAMDGAHEEHHVFEMHGNRWLHQPADPDSFLTDNQASNIGEWFNYEVEGNTNETIPGQFRRTGGMLKAGLPGDYLVGETSLENKWNGGWGIFRVENGPAKPGLSKLPGMPNPPVIPGLPLLSKSVAPEAEIPKVNRNLTEANSPCPAGAPSKLFNITAIQLPLTYNSVYNENDPFGLMYVLEKDKAAVLAGTKKPEPLVIRANQGDCVIVDLNNELPDLTAIATATSVTFPDGTNSATSLDPDTLQHFGDAQMQALVQGLPLNPQFVFAKWPMSNRVSLHPHLIKEVAAVGDGATVGFMRDQTIGPGENIRYIWYADEELGATLLDDYGDERSHRHHGLFAGLVIEPNGSRYFNSSNLSEEIESGHTAVIRLANGKLFREFVPLFTTGLNLRRANTLIPDFPDEAFVEVEHTPCSPIGEKCADVEDTGESGISYRTERLMNRVPLNIPVYPAGVEEIFNLNQSRVFSSREFGDPATPVFEANPGDPVVMRPMFPADLNRVLTIGLNGHVWRHEPNGTETNIVNVEGSFGVGKSFNYWLMGGAGGEQQQPGDYMYNDRRNVPINAGVQSGLWGIFRVHPVEGAPKTIADLEDIDVPVLTTLIISPKVSTLTIGGVVIQAFNATALDQNNNPISGINITWTSSNLTVGNVAPLNSITGTDGNATAAFTAEAAGTALVNATNSTLEDSATVTVTVDFIVPQPMTVFARGTDNAVWYIERNGTSWGDWQSLGGLITDLDVKSGYVAVRGTDNSVWVRKRTGASAWSDWENLGGSVVTRPVIAPSGSSTFIFAVGSDNGVWNRKWEGTSWSDWQSLGGFASSEISATSSGSVVNIFARGSDNGIWTRKWDGSVWSDWQSLGGTITSDPESVSSAGQTYIFARGEDNGVWYRKSDGSVWSDWQSLDGSVSSNISVSSSDTGNITIFVNGTDNGVWTRTWDGSVWSDWQGLGGSTASDPDSVSSSGQVHVFVRGGDDGVWTQDQNGGVWSDWQGLGGSIISEPVVTSG